MRDASLCDFTAESECASAEAAGDDASAGAMGPLPGCAPMSSQRACKLPGFRGRPHAGELTAVHPPGLGR